MILYQGKLYPSREQERLLKTLEGDVLTALAAPPPGPEAVIAACDALAGEVLAGRYDAEIQGLDLDPALRTAQVRAAAALLGRESLTAKFRQELGEGPFAPRWTASPGGAPASGGGGRPWACCSTSPRGMWTACRPTALWRASWPGT